MVVHKNYKGVKDGETNGYHLGRLWRTVDGLLLLMIGGSQQCQQVGQVLGM
jgi:hypothetical protein